MSGGRTTQYFLELLAACVEALPEAHTPDFLYPEDEMRSIVSDTLEPRCVERDAVLNLIALADCTYKMGREEAIGDFDIEDTLEKEATNSWERTLADNIPIEDEGLETFLSDRFTKVEKTTTDEQEEGSDLTGTVAQNLEEVHENRYVSS